MATSNYSLEPEGTPLTPLVPQVTHKVKEATTRGRVDRDSRADGVEHIEADGLPAQARKAKATWKLCAPKQRTLALSTKWKAANRAISEVQAALTENKSGDAKAATGSEWPIDYSPLLDQALKETQAALESTYELPQVLADGDQKLPRIYAAAENFLQAVLWRVQTKDLLVFMEAVQENSPFQDAELSALHPCLQLILLERIGGFAQKIVSGHKPAVEVNEDAALRLLHCLRSLIKLDWNMIFDTLSKTDHILREDPPGTYGRMDSDSRQEYRRAVAELASRSSWSEFDIAQQAIKLARGPHNVADLRAAERRSHVGYYLLDAGQDALKEAIGYDATTAERIRGMVLRWPTFFYLSSIALATCGIFAAVYAGSAGTPLTLRRLVILTIALIPVMECAVAITNLLVTNFLKPKRLPRMDFSAGIPEDCATLVAIPILLISDKQVRQSVKDLEIRYLANLDRNLHFALVTDPPDSLHPFDEKDALAGLCSSLIEELDQKYARRAAGSFVHLHRNRTHNKAEGIWMGWERKRGKMLDLNNYLLHKSDHFPVKAGNLAVLHSIRYVITLDQDTQLVTQSARKLVGALAHPLNRAVVDPTTGSVVEGYAILQPRVAISVKAAGRSRLASIYSGDSGFDIYTRAVSDAYQDLFGSGIYTGKGIYEVETFQNVLEHRFPCNVILSHDLIEGAHARAGFISDVEVVDDYPSHVSAYSRRKHRWVRGDWQIILWLFPRVPQSFGKLVPNPLSAISRWQIFDNLRRSLSEVATFTLLLFAWLFWPEKALFWTLTALFLTASPICFDFFVSLARAGRRLFSASFWKGAVADLAGRSAILLCRIILLCHQSLVALDAVVRTAIRMTVTHRRLLEWETAAEAEQLTSKGSAVESYLNWTAPAAIVIAGLIARFSPSSLGIALPFLMLWGTSKVFCDWLSRPYPKWESQISDGDRSALQHMALRTWRFFTEFCTEDENWLIPDVVQVDPPIVLHAASTTNIGLLLNAQLAARDLGFLTLSEFITVTERTLATVSKLPTHNGQFYNWYSTQTLEPQTPRFISTVDNGNLVCCLWTLKGACAELKSKPLIPNVLWQAVSAHLDAIEDGLLVDTRNDKVRVDLRDVRHRVDLLGSSGTEWLKALPAIAAKVGTIQRKLASSESNSQAAYWAGALSAHLRNIEGVVRDFAPWLLPEFSELRNIGPGINELTLESVPPLLYNLHAQIAAKLSGQEIKETTRPLMSSLFEALSRSLPLSQETLERLSGLGATADHLAYAQDFSMLYSPKKELLSIGYDAEANQLWDSYYDLLASEARAAVFVAIAKGDISQEVWFQMGRSLDFVNGRSALLSWTGTMFEYLMPSLWMKFYPNTLLEQAARVAVITQQEFATAKSAPWGISESSFSEKGPDGRYGYRAFGVPGLAMSRLNPDDLVITPYAAFLALMIDAVGSASNLRAMQDRGWLGTYGFCEAYDFTPSRLKQGQSYEVVECWMAHHQGMILVAAANALDATTMQRRFHAEPMVAATERLLQEVPRTAPDPVADESSDKLEWLKASVPVLGNFLHTALSAPQDKTELPATQRVRGTDG